MRYKLACTSTWKAENIIKKYPILNEYSPIIDYPYPNQQVDRLTIEVSDLIEFYNKVGEEIIINKDICENNDDIVYCLEIYDDYRE